MDERIKKLIQRSKHTIFCIMKDKVYYWNEFQRKWVLVENQENLK